MPASSPLSDKTLPPQSTNLADIYAPFQLGVIFGGFPSVRTFLDDVRLSLLVGLLGLFGGFLFVGFSHVGTFLNLTL